MSNSVAGPGGAAPLHSLHASSFGPLVQEIFAVQALPGHRFPHVLNDGRELIANSFLLPDEALADVSASLCDRPAATLVCPHRNYDQV